MSAQLSLPLPRARTPRSPCRVTYHQTTPMTADQLTRAIEDATHQDIAVMAIFRHWQQPMTPSQVWRYGCDRGMGWLLTSVRRSMTNLTDARVLVKASDHAQGIYGRPESLWRLA